MKILLISILSLFFFSTNAQPVGPPKNTGREYGNPKMPLLVSHLGGANKEMLKRANKNSRHSVFGKVICFRKLCRIQSGHKASLDVLSRRKFEKRVERNAKKGLYKRTQIDSMSDRRPAPIKRTPAIDTTTVSPVLPIPKPDSLIVLGAELLFETNKSTLRSEHFETLNSIVNYLILHRDRSVKISGHTDNVGTEEHNLALSERRAEVVAEYLIDKGVGINRVESYGFGSAKPIVPNASEEARSKNRRVELLIHNGQ